MCNVVTDVHNAGQDGLLYCGSIRLATRRTPWVQVIPGAMSLWWPYAESPHVVLFRDLPCSLRVRIVDWADEGFVLLSYSGEPPVVGAWLDEVFRGIYNCKIGYSVDTAIDDFASIC